MISTLSQDEIKEKINKEKNKSVINWKDINKILLVLIFFSYFTNITSNIYEMITTSFKMLIFLVMIQVVFKDNEIFKKFYYFIDSIIKKLYILFNNIFILE